MNEEKEAFEELKATITTKSVKTHVLSCNTNPPPSIKKDMLSKYDYTFMSNSGS